MKVTIDIDCTPEEARTFLGLPDVKPFQDAMMDKMRGQVQKTIDTLGPEAMMKAFFPTGIPGLEEMQGLFWRMASGGEDGAVSAVRLVSRRAFSGYWEYHLDDALFVAPPRRDQGGAGLFNGRGELVGVGSLVVSDALGSQAPGVPGNMFVPIDLLKPILAELRERGSSARMGATAVAVAARRARSSHARSGGVSSTS